MHLIVRIVGTLVLLALASFCAFGFLASAEYADPAARRPWQIGYGAVGILLVAGAILLWIPWKRRTDRADTSASN